MARGAHILAMHLQSRLSTADRAPEIHRRLVLEVGAWLRPVGTLLVLRSGKDAGEDVFEAAPAAALLLRARSALEPREIEPAKIDRHSAAMALLAGVGLGLRGVNLVGVEPELVIDLALLLVTQDVVGLGDFLELLLRLFVVGVYVGVIFARELTEGLADFLR